MRRLVDTDEAARILGMSYHALIKRVQRGKIVGEFVPGNRGGKAGQVLKVWIDEDQKAGTSRQEADKKEKNHTRVNRGEPGCHVVTMFENGMPRNQIPKQVRDDNIIEAPASLRAIGLSGPVADEKVETSPS